MQVALGIINPSALIEIFKFPALRLILPKMNFLDILIYLFVLFFIILFPLIFFGYRHGFGKKSKDNQNRGCWKTVFVLALVVTIIAIVVIVMIFLLGAAMTGNLS